MKTIYIVLACIFGIALIGWGGTSFTRSSYYCQQCGMKRLNDQRQWLGLTFQNSDKLYQTGYSELYFRGIATTCQHQWVIVSSNFSGNLLTGAETKRGTSSYALRLAPLCQHLRNLDKSKIPAVLGALSLRSKISQTEQKQIDEITKSLIHLGGVVSKPQTEKWWKKNSRLFVIKRTN